MSSVSLKDRIAEAKRQARIEQAIKQDPGFDFLGAAYGEVETAALHHLDAALGLCEPTVVADQPTRWERWQDDMARLAVLDEAKDVGFAESTRLLEEAERGVYAAMDTVVVFKGRIIRVHCDFVPKDSGMTADSRTDVWDAEDTRSLLNTRWVKGQHVQKFMGYVDPEREDDTVARQEEGGIFPHSNIVPPERIRSYAKLMHARMHANPRRVQPKVGEAMSLVLRVNGREYPMKHVAERVEGELLAEREARIEAWRRWMADVRPARSYDEQGNRVFRTPPHAGIPTRSGKLHRGHAPEKLHYRHAELAAFMGDPAWTNIHAWFWPVEAQGVAVRLGWLR